jgi:pimeloyl-ACP methyl ester carboxylesterase
LIQTQSSSFQFLRSSGLRATALLLVVLVLGGCVSAESWEATRLLEDIDAGAGPSALKESTPRASRTTEHYEIDGRRGRADLYEPHQSYGGAMVLVPGFTEWGKDDPRVVALARSLARARFLVLVPEVAGSRQLRVRLEDSRAIADAVIQLRRLRPRAVQHGLGVVAVSYAVGLAILAADPAEPETIPDFLIGIGGYFDSTAVITFATTGKFRLPGSAQWRSGEVLPAARWAFLAGSLDLIDAEADRQRLKDLSDVCWRGCDLAAETGGSDPLAGRLGQQGRALLALIINEDPARVPELLAALPEAMRARLDRMSPSRQDLAHLAGRLILVHGRLDPLIPYSESLALARAVPGSEVFPIDGFSHITPRGVDWAGQLQLIDAIQAVLRRRGSQ